MCINKDGDAVENLDSDYLYVKKLIEEGYIAEDFEPLKCHRCESKDLKVVDKTVDETGFPMEYRISCGQCNTCLGYWTYGHWQF
jgi:hypothetical protein